jgi:hypothetical protein
MSKVILALPQKVHRALWDHLLPQRLEAEQAAFVFARLESNGDSARFGYLDWVPIPEVGFEYRSDVYLELADISRAKVIKQAHDLGASLIEFHSHTGAWPAAFSPSDLDGFTEFVPHVWWRLRGRPYAAVVVSRDSFDGLVWRKNPESPERLQGILVGGGFVQATGLTSLRGHHHDDPKE